MGSCARAGPKREASLARGRGRGGTGEVSERGQAMLSDGQGRETRDQEPAVNCREVTWASGAVRGAGQDPWICARQPPRGDC